MAKSKKLPEKPDIELLTNEAIEDKEKIKSHVVALSGDSRHDRQTSASVLNCISAEHPELVEGYIDDILDALNRPERQTRWECFTILSGFVETHTKECEGVIEQAESALFDEHSGILRFSAFNFLCKLGECSAKTSDKVWPLIDEAVQCYHGDVEFNDMLNSLTEFSKGKISANVKESLTELFNFDAETATGNLQSKALQIIDNCKTKKKATKKKG